jgi:hypothetical protein
VQHEDLLVLKSEFNSAWNYFSAKELGDTVLGYWHGWMTAAESGAYNSRYPLFDGRMGDLTDEGIPGLCSEILTPDGPICMPDIRKCSLAKARTIVSRKRTRNLFDLTSLWKKAVFTKLDVNASELAQDLVVEVENRSPPHKKTLDPSRHLWL